MRCSLLREKQILTLKKKWRPCWRKRSRLTSISVNGLYQFLCTLLNSQVIIQAPSLTSKMFCSIFRYLKFQSVYLENLLLFIFEEDREFFIRTLQNIFHNFNSISWEICPMKFWWILFALILHNTDELFINGLQSPALIDEHCRLK